MRRVKIILFAAILSMGTLFLNHTSADVLQNDFQKLQGTWTLYYAETDGICLLPTTKILLVINNNRYLTAANTPGAVLGVFGLGQMAWPRQIDYTPLTGPYAGQTSLGIYGVIGGTQVICFAQPGQPRPTDFSTFPGSGRTLNIWLVQP
jgi:uncharacterized protein (TIGR03067 family)